MSVHIVDLPIAAEEISAESYNAVITSSLKMHPKTPLMPHASRN